MKALRANNGHLALENVSKPHAEEEALIRVLVSGICNTDLEIVRGYSGFNGTIGHEFVGMVEECSALPGLIGKRVVGEINAGCGRCNECSEGDPRHCPGRTVLGIVGRDGCHAEFTALPAANLCEVPASVADEEAVFIEPLAAAFGIGEQVEIGPETRVAVVGDGKLGLLCAFTLRLRTDRLLLIGRHRDKLKLAEATGVEGILENDAIRRERCFDVVVEASGSEAGFRLAAVLVRPRGKIVLKSTFHGTPTWPAAKIVVDEITVVGSRCGRFGPAIDLLERRAVNVLPLITDEMGIDDGVRGVNRAAEKGVLKVILRMDR